MLSKKPMKTIILSQLPHKERQEYFKFLLNNKITFTKEANGDYVTMIRVINPDYLSNESNEKNTVKSGKIGQKQKEIMNKNYYEKNSSNNNHSKSSYNGSKHSECSADNRNPIPKQINLSNQRIQNYNEIFSKKYAKFYNEVKPLIGIRGKKCNLFQLKYLIEEIYSIRFIQDSNNLKNQLLNERSINLNNPFPIFLYDYFVNKYVKKAIIDQQALNLLLSIEYFKEANKDIEIFAKLLNEEYDNDDLVFFLFVRSCIEKETGIMFLEKAQDEINIQHMEEKDFIDTEIYLNTKLCLNIATTIFGEDEKLLIKSFMNKIEKRINIEKGGINASVLLALTLDDYHESRKYSNSKNKITTENENEESIKEEENFFTNENEKQNDQSIKFEKANEKQTCFNPIPQVDNKSSNNNSTPFIPPDENEEGEENEDVEENEDDSFYPTLIGFYYQEQIKNNLPKNDIIQGILSTYLQEKEINVFFDKIFNYDTEDPNVDAKLNQIKALIIKKLTYLISVLFNADKKAWFVSLKITQNIQKANSHYQHLLSLLGQIISYETIKDIPEVLIEEFCQNILTTNELMTQIMKVIEKNF